MAPQKLTWLLRGKDNGPKTSKKSRRSSIASEKASARSLTTANGSLLEPLNEKSQDDSPGRHRGTSMSMSVSTSGANATTGTPEESIPDDGPAAFKRIVRTVPAWVRDADEDDLIWYETFGAPATPKTAAVAQHNHTPSTRPGRKYDSLRSDHAYIPHRPHQETSRWVTFAKTSAYPREPDECENVSVEWLNQNFGDYSTPWLAGLDEEAGEGDSTRYHAFRRRERVWHQRMQMMILRNPFVPLCFRLTVFAFSAVALSLGAAIYSTKSPDQGPSAEMAIVVDVIAMIYTVYITVDEYISKPLGLRSVRAKLRLVFLDLIFIVFEAANLALAMEGVGHGQGCGAEDSIHTCHRQKALAGVLNIALVAWLLTFAVSVIRLVERVVQR